MLLKLIKSAQIKKRAVFFPIFFVALYALSSIALAAFSGLLISKTALGIAIGLLHIPIAMVRLLGLTKPAAKYFENYFSHDSLFVWISKVREWFFNKAKQLSLSRLSSFENGRVLKHFIRDISELEKFFILGFIPQISAFVSFSVISTLLLLFSLKLALTNFLLYLLVAFIIPYFTKKLNAARQEKQEEMIEKQNQLSYEMFQGFLEIKFHPKLKKYLSDLFNDLEKKINRLETRTNLSLSFWNLLSKITLYIFLLLVFKNAVSLVFSKEMNSIFMVLLIVSYLTYIDILDNIPASFYQIKKASFSSKNIVSFIESPSDEAHGQKNQEVMPFLLNERIEIKRLNFQYENTKKPIFEDLSLSFFAKKQSVLYAPSGYGKSTLLKLLLKYYPLANSTIFIDGVDLNAIKTESLFAEVSYISQETFVFSSSLRENLLIAKPKASDEEIIEVLKLVQLERLLQSREGLDTFLGEAGNRLSGGERQRIAIARAYLKKSSLILLDEASASLDWRNKMLFDEMISKLLIDGSTVIRFEVSLENIFSSSNKEIIHLKPKTS